MRPPWLHSEFKDSLSYLRLCFRSREGEREGETEGRREGEGERGNKNYVVSIKMRQLQK